MIDSEYKCKIFPYLNCKITNYGTCMPLTPRSSANTNESDYLGLHESNLR